jgi:hypothetical protein
LSKAAGQGSLIADEDKPTADSLEVDETAETVVTSRYVDLAGNPLPPSARPYPEFNLLPVHLVVVIDEPQLPIWLRRLALSDMAVDVMYAGVMERELKETSLGPTVRRYQPTYAQVEILGVIRVFNPPAKSV